MIIILLPYDIINSTDSFYTYHPHSFTPYYYLAICKFYHQTAFPMPLQWLCIYRETPSEMYYFYREMYYFYREMYYFYREMYYFSYKMYYFSKPPQPTT